MCGLVGFTKPGPGAEALAESLASRAAFRGPDGDGAFVDGDVALAHRRLAVLDPSPSGAQPMRSQDGRYVIIHNGEIYNHRRLRAEMPPRQWNSKTDTETILALFAERGPNFVTAVRGMFAFAIHDTRRRVVHLYRDRLGIKPLFIAKHNGRWFFGSDVRMLAAHPQFPREIDEGALDDYLLFGYVPGGRSIWRAAKPLPPGTRLDIDLQTGKSELHRWWNAADYTETDERISEREAENQLDALVDKAVSEQLLSDRPIGCFLSGGVDSSLIASSMVRATDEHVRTFHVSFREKSHDESRPAARVARLLGTEHTSSGFTPRECLNAVHSIPDIAGQPFADPSLLPTALLAESARRHVVVALSGDGGDELFHGYERYQWLERTLTRTARVPAGVRQAAGKAAAALPGRNLPRIGAGFQYPDERRLYGYIVAGWNAPFVRALRRRPIRFENHPFHDLAGETKLRGTVERAAFADLKSYLPGDILAKVDQATMFHGLEARVPLLDHRIVEFALGLPARLKQGDGAQKVLLRRVLSRRLPAALFDRPKAGFAVPLEQWFRGPLKPLVRQHLRPSALAAHGFFDAGTVDRAVREHVSGKRNRAFELWTLLVFQLWWEGQGL